MFSACLCHRCLNVYLHVLLSQNTTLKVRVCHSSHMFTVYSSASSVPRPRGGLVVRLVRVVMNEQPFLLTHKPTQMSNANRCYRWNNGKKKKKTLSAAAFLCTTGWHCSSSLVIPSSLHHSLPHVLLFSLALSLRLHILCRRKIKISREHSEDYQIDIGDNLFLPSLLHGLSLHFPLLSASVTHSLSVVNLCFHPLPFKSLIASGYIREDERAKGWGGVLDR